jgi:hypothetical protein
LSASVSPRIYGNAVVETDPDTGQPFLLALDGGAALQDNSALHQEALSGSARPRALLASLGACQNRTKSRSMPAKKTFE